MERKKVQFATLFQILEGGRPMVEYESNKALYSFINVFKNPKMHWFDSSSWIMAGFIYVHVTKAILAIIFIINYVALPCDEVNIVDNWS
jgi:hypothetical protein